jgi:hypothetical protein
VTKDGVSVAKENRAEDKLRNMGAQMVRKSLPRRLTSLVTAPRPRLFWQAIVREGMKSA